MSRSSKAGNREWRLAVRFTFLTVLFGLALLVSWRSEMPSPVWGSILFCLGVSLLFTVDAWLHYMSRSRTDQ